MSGSESDGFENALVSDDEEGALVIDESKSNGYAFQPTKTEVENLLELTRKLDDVLLTITSSDYFLSHGLLTVEANLILQKKCQATTDAGELLVTITSDILFPLKCLLGDPENSVGLLLSLLPIISNYLTNISICQDEDDPTQIPLFYTLERRKLLYDLRHVVDPQFKKRTPVGEANEYINIIQWYYKAFHDAAHTVESMKRLDDRPPNSELTVLIETLLDSKVQPNEDVVSYCQKRFHLEASVLRCIESCDIYWEGIRKSAAEECIGSEFIKRMKKTTAGLGLNRNHMNRHCFNMRAVFVDYNSCISTTLPNDYLCSQIPMKKLQIFAYGAHTQRELDRIRQVLDLSLRKMQLFLLKMSFWVRHVFDETKYWSQNTTAKSKLIELIDLVDSDSNHSSNSSGVFDTSTIVNPVALRLPVDKKNENEDANDRTILC